MTILGKTESSIVIKSVSTKAASQIGSASIQDDRLSEYVRIYRKVRNIFNTDLFSFLGSVPDRKVSFDNFLIQFKGSYEQMKLANEDLLQEISDYTKRYDVLNNESQVVETKFFTALDGLNSEALPELLKSFEDINLRKNIVFSELKARQAIAEKYAKSIPLIKAKITAIELNSDPFVKGVKVIEFQQIDLDLIIQGNVGQ